MHIELVAHRFELPDTSRADIKTRIEKLGGLGLEIVDATLSLEQIRNRYIAEITLFGKRASFHAQTQIEADTVSQAIEAVLSKAEKQIRRHLDRLRDAKRRRKEPEVLEGEPSMPEIPEYRGRQPIEEVAKVAVVPAPERIEAKPMSPEEAAEQLTARDAAFLAFRNAETSELNVVFRREDGAIGWIHA